MIHCCSEHSEYDPATGARVLGGPAPQPLSAILLEHDKSNDYLYAVGTLGACERGRQREASDCACRDSVEEGHAAKLLSHPRPRNRKLLEQLPRQPREP